MLLRRITEHVKAQNWTAVALDFVIVVVGVFIGLQVSNWNLVLSDRETEAQYLARLQHELADMSPQADAGFDDTRNIDVLLEEVKDYFETGVGEDSLSGAHCAALVRSHIFANTIFYPPTIKELISTGRIVLIRDDALRTAILSFDGVNTDMTQLRTDVQIDRQLLARNFPDLVQLNLSIWEESVCAFDEMASNTQFLNDFTDNRHRYRAYLGNIVRRQSELIRSLGETVAASRGTAFVPEQADNAEAVDSGEQQQ